MVQMLQIRKAGSIKSYRATFNVGSSSHMTCMIADSCLIDPLIEKYGKNHKMGD